MRWVEFAKFLLDKAVSLVSYLLCGKLPPDVPSVFRELVKPPTEKLMRRLKFVTLQRLPLCTEKFCIL